MQIRLECYENELDTMLANIKAVFDVKSVSKFYPNVRQTSVETCCEGRVYVKINHIRENMCQKIVDTMTTDMLQYLKKIQSLDQNHVIDEVKEIEKIRQFYTLGSRLSDPSQLIELSSTWKDVLLGKVINSCIHPQK